MTDKKKSKGDHLSETQKELILAFMKDDLQFAAGKFDQNNTHRRAQMKWKELSDILNTFPGSKKDWKSWKRAWQDIKSKTKLKYMQQGSRRKILIPLNKFQDEIMKLIKHTEELYGKCEKDDWLDDLNFEEKYGEQIDVTYNDCIEGNDQGESILMKSKRIKREKIEDLETKEEIKIIFSEPEESEKYDLKYGNSKSLTSKPHSVYYEKKLAILERIAVAKEKSAVTQQEIVFELKNITSLLLRYMNK